MDIIYKKLNWTEKSIFGLILQRHDNTESWARSILNFSTFGPYGARIRGWVFSNQNRKIEIHFYVLLTIDGS